MAIRVWLQQSNTVAWKIVLVCFVLCLSILFTALSSQNSYAEEAVAIDSDVEEIIVAGKVLKDHQAIPQINQQNNQSKSSQQVNQQSDNQQNSASTTATATDTASPDESIVQRELPAQLNAPIIDQSNVLSSAENAQLTQKIQNIYQQGKAQVGIVIVPSTGQEDIFQYGMRVADEWKLGSAERDNGLLIVVALNDRRIQILTGYGLEGVLPDIITHRIIQNQIKPQFQQQQYAQGLNDALGEIDRILSQDPEVAQQAAEELKQRQAEAHQQQQAQQNTFGFSLFILVGAVIASAWFGRKISALGAGVAGTALGMVNGIGLTMSLALGFGMFFLVISSLAQILFQAFLSGGGRGGGGSSGGGFGGGGYSGGGGSFGGGGASGSW
ncbi:TPM domain-containing protein [Acinetobacter sp. A3.8]|uniref:TPM domain-containing protein n=1 Tax=Acinetobacter sedimenti TaxID=2919922 RepID=A0A9X1WX22_9GAMM|nr:TPM domain-containing protein [Acinetobacter sedimenti]MCJ8146098.1 TPM domain-containing protein [Acinetobacter sedimenti]